MSNLKFALLVGVAVEIWRKLVDLHEICAAMNELDRFHREVAKSNLLTSMDGLNDRLLKLAKRHNIDSYKFEFKTKDLEIVARAIKAAIKRGGRLPERVNLDVLKIVAEEGNG